MNQVSANRWIGLWVAFVLIVLVCLSGQESRGAELPAVPGLDAVMQLRDGLSNSRTKFVQEKSGVVGYVGGSITFAQGWSQQVDAELQRRFPETRFTFVHAGIPSIDSSGHAFRLQQDLLQRGVPDLVFVEAAVNDLHNERSAVERERAMEGIVRRLRKANRFVDVVFLHFAEPRHTADYERGRIPEVIASHELVAEHYGVASLNLAHEVQLRMAAGQFTWDKDFKDLHPSPFGHELYARAISRLFERAWTSADASVAPATLQERKLPAPRDPNCYDAGVFVPLAQATELSGFRVVEAWRPEIKAGTREGFVNVPMLVGQKPGDQFTLAFEGRGVGLFFVSGPDTAEIEYRIDGGSWKKRGTVTRWSEGLYLPWVLMLETELESRPHQLQLRLAQAQQASEKGTALIVRNLLVNGPNLEVPKLTEITVPSSLDGTDQPSMLWAPVTASRELTPLLIYLHSWSGDYRQDNAAWQREAVRRGWIYLHPNFRGVNKQPQACGSRWARQDILDALDWVSKAYRVDPHRIYLAGTSGGGHMAMLMAAYAPQRFSAVSAWVGISDLAEWQRFHVKDGKPDHYAQMTVDSLGGTPGASSEVDAAYRERSPLFHLHQAVGLPMDIAAGVTDGHTGSVPIAHSLLAFNTLAKACAAKEVGSEEIEQLWTTGRLTSPTAADTSPDPSYGREILLRRTAAAARVTIFQGGHEGLPFAACEWLGKQDRAVASP